MSQSINLYNQLANHKHFNKKVNFGLNRIKLALNKLGHPEEKLSNVIQVIGSDGKFSHLTNLKFFIEANNQTVATHISPSLKDISERFWMGDRYLTHFEIKQTIKIIEKLKIPLTVFEVLTLVFIINAAKRKNDYIIVNKKADFDISKWKEKCYQAMDDDFNSPLLIANIFDAVKLINKLKADGKSLSKKQKETLSNQLNIFIFEILGLQTSSGDIKSNEESKKLDKTIKILMKLRDKARMNKDFKTADLIRDELCSIGIQLKDEKDNSSFNIN